MADKEADVLMEARTALQSCHAWLLHDGTLNKWREGMLTRAIDRIAAEQIRRAEEGQTA